jgi:hypothetical protein
VVYYLLVPLPRLVRMYFSLRPAARPAQNASAALAVSPCNSSPRSGECKGDDNCVMSGVPSPEVKNCNAIRRMDACNMLFDQRYPTNPYPEQLVYLRDGARCNADTRPFGSETINLYIGPSSSFFDQRASASYPNSPCLSPARVCSSPSKARPLTRGPRGRLL